MSPIRFSEVWDECKKHVTKSEDWVILYNKETEEHAMMQWDPVREKKFYLLSNAFRNRKFPSNTGKKTMENQVNVVWETYEHLF